jgi:hypothetical protein
MLFPSEMKGCVSSAIGRAAFIQTERALKQLKRRRPIETHATVKYFGVMEYWSVGVLKQNIKPLAITPILQYSNTPKPI